MLEMANIKPGETLYDLGCGDGRILIAAVGNIRSKRWASRFRPSWWRRPRQRSNGRGWPSQAQVIQGDLLDVDLTGADVVTIYLATPFNEQLRPRLEKYLKPARGWFRTITRCRVGSRPRSTRRTARRAI